MKSKPPWLLRLRSSRRVVKMSLVMIARCCKPGPSFCSRKVCIWLFLQRHHVHCCRHRTIWLCLQCMVNISGCPGRSVCGSSWTLLLSQVYVPVSPMHNAHIRLSSQRCLRQLLSQWAALTGCPCAKTCSRALSQGLMSACIDPRL